MNISAPMIKAVLFDLDDLMVNSAPLHIEASRRVFLRFGVDVRDIPNEVMSSYFGKRTWEIQRLIADHYKLSGKIDIEGLTEERERIFLDLVRSDLEPMPGLFDLVKTIKLLGFKRAIASSGVREYIGVILEKLGLKDFFHVIVSGDMVENGKPAPDIFLRAAKELIVDPSECLVIEDAMAGVAAAKGAGMRCIGVDNQLSPYKQDLSKADRVVKRLDEIDEKMLKGLN